MSEALVQSSDGESGAEPSGNTEFPQAQRMIPKSRLKRFFVWARHVGLERRLALGLATFAIIFGIATVAVMTRSGPLGPDPDLVLALVYSDIAFVLALGGLIARQLVRMWLERRRGQAGSRLHMRLALLFAVLAIVPALLVSVFSGLFFDLGLRGWFSERVETAVTSSSAVAKAYLREHKQTIRADTLAMANDLNREAALLLSDPRRMAQVVSAQAALRNLTEAVVFESSGRILGRSSLAFSFEFEPLPVEEMADARRTGDVMFLGSDSDDRIRALIALNQFVDTYLYVGRFVDAEVLAHVAATDRAVTDYIELEGRRFDIQLTFAIMFLMVALLLLLAAIWIGLQFADRLTRPVTALVHATERVREGDYSARVVPSGVVAELTQLSRAFNRMTAQLESQRRELVDANHLLDERRRFTEAVLGGVSAGVVGLDEFGAINLPNRSASRLLDQDLIQFLGTPLPQVVPEFGDLMEDIKARPWRAAEAQTIVKARDGSIKTFLARLTAEVAEGEVVGYVLTFDDVTELVSAQRKAAWADVARRIAHEIKNPLTPIQLSAERLRRKYQTEIESDQGTFSLLIDTIVRQVEDIGRMVDEFSSFARMPNPVMKPERLDKLLEAQVALYRAANPNVSFELNAMEALNVTCDSRQIRQVLSNVLQNAVDSIEGRREAGEAELAGVVQVSASAKNRHILIEIADNGKGFPEEDRSRLTEPYVTTREKGTGLGLAIVKKIMEDHKATLDLRDREGGGALVALEFERDTESEEDQGSDA